MSNGKMDQAKGRVKQAAGDLTDDDELRREGKVDEQTGKIKEAVGKVADKAEELIDDARNAVKKDHAG